MATPEEQAGAAGQPSPTEVAADLARNVGGLARQVAEQTRDIAQRAEQAVQQQAGGHASAGATTGAAIAGLADAVRNGGGLPAEMLQALRDTPASRNFQDVMGRMLESAQQIGHGVQQAGEHLQQQVQDGARAAEAAGAQQAGLDPAAR